MAIEFHCDHCGKLVRASDEHGGKRGRCPSCHQSVYIPTADSELAPLELAPIDRDAERERQRMDEESRRLAATMLRERGSADAREGVSAARDAAATRESTTARESAPRIDMEALVIDYAAAMADGDLKRAEGFAATIRQNLRAAEEVMQRITVDQIPPPKLAKIPRPVLVGFFKQLREKK